MKTIYTLFFIFFFLFTLSLNAQQEDKYEGFSLHIEIGVHHPIFAPYYIYSNLNRPRSNDFFNKPFGLGYDININAPIEGGQKFYLSSSFGLLNLSSENYSSLPPGISNMKTIDSWNPYAKLNIGYNIIQQTRYRLSIEGIGGIGLLKFPAIHLRTFFFEGPNLPATTNLDMHFTPIVSFTVGGKLTNQFKINERIRLGFILKHSAWLVGQNVLARKEREGEITVDIREDFDTIQIPAASLSITYTVSKS